MASVGVSALIMRGRALLLVRRSSNEELFPGRWELPGGGVEHGEDPYETVKREVREETGLSAREPRPVDVFHYVHDGRHAVDIVFSVEADGDVALSGEHDDYAWVDPLTIDDYDASEEVKTVIRRATS